ncbi:hypothetical protein BVI2075_1940002 [Burkholderia vietnamiensis]|nr:hypothetical protein BVI2075_1940002 [Burkholderia vietnamiensis]
MGVDGDQSARRADRALRPSPAGGATGARQCAVARVPERLDRRLSALHRHRHAASLTGQLPESVAASGSHQLSTTEESA